MTDMWVRPLVFDLFCGAGGAAMGYHRAGFDVVGVDIHPQPDYPFTFVQDDALDFLRFHLDVAGMPTVPTAIHASPPCQWSCNLTKGTNKGREYLNLIPETRELLARTGLPTVIENVQGSDVRRDLTLCGEMFGLSVIRHRYFECSFPVETPPHVKHRGRVAGMRHGEWFTGPYFAVYGEGGGKGTVAPMAGRDGHSLDRRAEVDRRGDPTRVHAVCRQATDVHDENGCMTDQQQRTQWAIDVFNGFVQSWVPPAVSRGLWTKRNPVNDDERVRTAIRAIATLSASRRAMNESNQTDATPLRWHSHWRPHTVPRVR